MISRHGDGTVRYVRVRLGEVAESAAFVVKSCRESLVLADRAMLIDERTHLSYVGRLGDGREIARCSSLDGLLWWAQEQGMCEAMVLRDLLVAESVPST